MVVVGKNSFLKKDKTGMCYVLVCIVDFSDNQLNAGALGHNARNIFISKDFYDRVQEEHFNRECLFDYGTNSFGSPEPVGFIFASS